MDGRSGIVGRTAPVGLVIIALISPAAIGSGEGVPASLELALLGEDGPRRLVLDVEIEGESVPALWDGSVAALIRLCDRDGDAMLDAEEATGLPSAFGLGQLSWGVFRLSGPAPPWRQLDSDGDGLVGATEVSAYYLRQGVGPVLVGVGRAPFTDALNETISRHLDSNEDGRVDRDEAGDAEALLVTLDRNGDGMLAADEICPTASYPGTRGTSRLAPPHPDRRPPGRGDIPLAMLPGPGDDGGNWAEGLAGHPDVSADAEALREWRLDAPGWRWKVVFSGASDATAGPPADRPPGCLSPVGWLTASGAGIAWHLRADEGTLVEGLRGNRRRLAAQFVAADNDADGEVRPGDLVESSLAPLVLALTHADRDGDGIASREDLDAWTDLIDSLARGRVLVMVLDHGRGLFEFIDSDHDGALAIRELRTAAGRLDDAGCLADGVLDSGRLPRTLIGSISRGQPARELAVRPPAGPDWFIGMDRNRDGDIAADEWIGDPSRFRALDSDRDGLLSIEEAMAIP